MLFSHWTACYFETNSEDWAWQPMAPHLAKASKRSSFIFFPVPPAFPSQSITIWIPNSTMGPASREISLKTERRCSTFTKNKVSCIVCFRYWDYWVMRWVLSLCCPSFNSFNSIQLDQTANCQSFPPKPRNPTQQSERPGESKAPPRPKLWPSRSARGVQPNTSSCNGATAKKSDMKERQVVRCCCNFLQFSRIWYSNNHVIHCNTL